MNQQQKLPNAIAVLVLGILSILTCCCWGIIGFILSIVGLVLANKDLALYNANPGLYTNYDNLKIGRILCMVGLGINILYFLLTIVSLIFDLGMMGASSLYDPYGGYDIYDDYYY